MRIGLIGGTGFYQLIEGLKEETVNTEYGDVKLLSGMVEGKEIFFLPRHGLGHTTLAPFINYRANIMAFNQLGVKRVFAVSAVGAINRNLKVGSLSLLDQFVDLTTQREKTFGKFSVDITEPFCPELQDCFRKAAKRIGEPLHEKITLVCVDGPRYETKAEIELFASWGMDVVGMTTATEASLARELGMCYAVVTLTTNMAAGLSGSTLSLKGHKQAVDSKREILRKLCLEAILFVKESKACRCEEAYERALMARAGK